MTHARLRLPIHLALLGALLVAGCATTQRPVTLTLDTRLLGGTESQASIQVPSDWYQESKKPDRAVFVGPDNFSRIYFSTLESLTPVTECDALVRRAIDEFKAEHARGAAVEVELTPAGAAPQVGYDFRMTVPSTPPGPNNRAFVGRASCDAGGIGLVGCAVGKNRVSTLGKTCNEVAASLTVTPVATTASASPAPAAPAQPEAPAPAAATPDETPADPTPSGSQPIDQPQAEPLPEGQQPTGTGTTPAPAPETPETPDSGPEQSEEAPPQQQ